MTTSHRVLIVEDDARQSAFLARVLGEALPGVEVVLAASAAACLIEVESRAFDVVLLDDTLPDAHVADLLRGVRQNGLGDPHVIVLSELTDPSAASDVLQLGGAELVPKSLNLRRTLPVLMRRTLDERRLRQSFDIGSPEYRSLLEKTSDGIYILSGNRFVFVNQRFEQLFGLGHNEVIDDDFDYESLIAPDSREMIRERARRSSRGEMLEPRYEFVGMTRGGERFDVGVSVAYIEYQGQPATLGILQDITERKAFEKALVRRNRQLAVLNDIAATVNRSLDLTTVLDIAAERLMSVMNLSAAGIALVNPRLNVIESHVFRGVSDVFRRSLRAIPIGSGIMGLAASTGELIVVDDLRTDPRVHIDEVRQTGFVSTVAVPVKAQGKVLGVAVCFSDSPRVFSGEELDLLQHIGNQIGTAVDKAQIHERQKATVRRLVALDEITRLIGGTLDTREVFSLAASQLRRLVGCDRVSVSLFDPAHDRFDLHFLSVDGIEVAPTLAQVSRTDSALGEAIESHHAVTVDLEQAKGEYERHLAEKGMHSFVTVPIVVERMPVGTLNLSWLAGNAVDNDVLEILSALAAHLAVAIKNARLFSELESTLAELKAAQEQLVQTGRLEALGELAAGVAHDFNNVLGAILGRAQLLKNYIHDEALRKNLDVIERAALDGAATVLRVQEYSRTQREPPSEVVDLCSVAQDAVDYTQPRWHDRPLREGLRIEVELRCEPVPTVRGNAHELREVLTNLIHNACDAMPTGGRILVRTGIEARGSFVEVKDEGSGMPAEVRARVFDPFYTTKGVRGSGLGLSVSHTIIKQHLGHIEVESEPGQGTAFRIVIPAAAIDQAAASEAEVAPPGMRARILVIDDEEPIREVLADILQTADHEVVLAEDGEQGLALFDQGTFDLVFTDLGMPGLSGFDVVRELKKRRPEIPVGLLTGWGASVDEIEMCEAGVDVLVSKPFKFDEVLAVVRDILGRRHTG
ncbi:MAG: response regulator [Pseudomonadota bacterium]